MSLHQSKSLQEDFTIIVFNGLNLRARGKAKLGTEWLPRDQEKYKEAEQMHRQALEGLKKVLGEEHPNTLDSMNSLAIVLNNQGKYEKAEQMHRQALEGSMKVLDKEHPDTLDRMNSLALVLDGQGKYEEAERIRSCLKG